MKKNYFILLTILFLSTNLFAVSETVDLGTNPGTLSTALVNAPTTVTDLIVTGQINNLDFQFMKTSITTLANVDLSGATIVEYVDNNVSPAVTYPANEIPGTVFQNKTTLASVKLPPTTTRVGEYAFKGCTNLETVDYGTSISTFGQEAFMNCGKLTTPPNNLPITNIGARVFQSSGITGALVLQEGLTAIQDAAFHSCQKLTSVTLPSTLTSIRTGAFAGASGTTSNILTFNIYATTPPTLLANVFLRRNVNSELHVPTGSKSVYEAAGTQWTQFAIIDDLQPVSTNIESQTDNNKIQILSNKNSLNIYSDKEISEITVYDMSGKIVYSAGYLHSNSVDVPLSAKGIFIVKVSLVDGYNEILKTVSVR